MLMVPVSRFSPMGLRAPLGLPQNDEHAKTSHAAEKAKEKDNTKGRNPFTTRLNMRKWDYDPSQVIQQMDNRK
jgi:hypothetical protein